MSIFDDLSKDSFFSKRATNKQSGGSSKNRTDAEAASDMSVENIADAEVASDMSAGTRAGNRGAASRNQSDTEIASDISARNQAGTSGALGMASRTGAAEAAGTSMTDATDTEFASDFRDNPNTGVVTDRDTAGTRKSGLTAADTTHTSDTAVSDVAMKGVEETDTEFADMTGFSQYGTQNYSHAGVAFNKLSDGEARINYAGLLSKDGAHDVTGIYGYGSNQSWENVSSVNLSKDYSGNFTATIPIVSGKNVNFAFKDQAENWDNNSGLNYTFVN